MSATAASPMLRDAPVTVGAWRNSLEWDEFVERSPQATLYHLSTWRELLREVLDIKTWYRVARTSAGGTAGLLPLAHVMGPFDHYLMSLPFLNAGGPIGSSVAQAALVHDAIGDAATTGVTMMELRSAEPIAGELPATPRKITVRLDLPALATDLWTAFPPKLRSQIRRAERAGFTVRFGAERVRDFYAVFVRHMHELGTPALPRAWFEALADGFSRATEICVVYDGALPIAAGFGFHWRDTVEIVWASAVKAYSAAAPNMLMYWSFITRAIERGATVFDFGRCSRGSGTHRFKLQWGGREVPLPWVQWSPPGRPGAGMPSTDGAPFQLAARVWRRLPYPIARVMGPTVARWLP